MKPQDNITHEDVRLITQRWLTQKKLKPSCPLCKSKTMKIGIISRLPDAIVSGAGFRVIPLVCSACAYTMFLAADPIILPLPKDR